MAPLTWRNVNAPDLNSSARTILSAGSSLNAGFTGLSDTLGDVRDRQKDRRSMPIIDQLLAASTEEEAAAALQGVSGGVANRDRSDTLLNIMGQVRADNLGYEDSRAMTAHRLQQTSNLSNADARANANASQSATDRADQEADEAALLQLELNSRVGGETPIVPDTVPDPAPDTVPDPDPVPVTVPFSPPTIDRNKTLRPAGKAGEEGKDVPTPRNFEPGTETLGFGSAVDNAILSSGLNLGPAAGSQAPNDGRIVPPTPLTTRADVSEADLAAAGVTSTPTSPPIAENVDVQTILQKYVDDGVIETRDQLESVRATLLAQNERLDGERLTQTAQGLMVDLDVDPVKAQEDIDRKINAMPDLDSDQRVALRAETARLLGQDSYMFESGSTRVTDQITSDLLGEDVEVDGEVWRNGTPEAVTENINRVADLATARRLGSPASQFARTQNDAGELGSVDGEVAAPEVSSTPRTQADVLRWLKDDLDQTDSTGVNLGEVATAIQTYSEKRGVPIELFAPSIANSLEEDTWLFGVWGGDMEMDEVALDRAMEPYLTADSEGELRYDPEKFLAGMEEARTITATQERATAAQTKYTEADADMAVLLNRGGGQPTDATRPELERLANVKLEASQDIFNETNAMRRIAGVPTTQDRAAALADKNLQDTLGIGEQFTQSMVARNNQQARDLSSSNATMTEAVYAATEREKARTIQNSILGINDDPQYYNRSPDGSSQSLDGSNLLGSPEYNNGTPVPLSDEKFDDLTQLVDQMRTLAENMRETNPEGAAQLDGALMTQIESLNRQDELRNNPPAVRQGFKPPIVNSSQLRDRSSQPLGGPGRAPIQPTQVQPFNENSGAPASIASANGATRGATPRSPSRPGDGSDQAANRSYDTLVNRDQARNPDQEMFASTLTSTGIDGEELNTAVRNYAEKYGIESVHELLDRFNISVDDLNARLRR
jgi:hypothetical protein